MLPSWIRSRNCRPRLVYFLAIEITRRRLASTISFLARRAFASPTAISRLISLISAMDRCVRISIVAQLLLLRSMSSRRRPSAAECLRLARTCLSSQCRLVSLRGKVSMKSERGMPASRTQICITDFSMLRISFRCSRSWPISWSNIFGASLSSMNSSASFLRSLTRLRVARALVVERLDDLAVELRQRGEAARGLFRVRAGVDDFLVLGAFRVLGLVLGLFLGGRRELRVHRLGDHVRRVRVDEADDDVDQAALAGLHRLVGAQQQVEGRRVRRTARGARNRGLPRCAWRSRSRPRG